MFTRQIKLSYFYNMNSKEHWEEVYRSKNFEEVSWYQAVPETSLAFIDELKIPKNAAIMDAGGGDSYLSEYLLQKGFCNVSVLDISKQALQKVQQRLGSMSSQIQWVEADISNLKLTK